jgi:hypothetical protein
MFGNMTRIIARIKESWQRELEDEAIREACLQAGHRWRERQLGPVTTIKMFLLQILYGNVACNFVPHLAGKRVSGSSYCEARSRLPLAALEALLTTCTKRMAECVRDTGRWLGHRLLILDGCHFSMPDVPELAQCFGYPPRQAEGCGFPVAHWMALVHFGTGLIQKGMVCRVGSHDLPSAVQMHPELEAGDVVLGDRAFCSFAHYALLVRRGVHGIFRASQKINIDFTPNRPQVSRQHPSRRGKKGQPSSHWIQALGPQDQIVEWTRPLAIPSWLSAEAFRALPDRVRLRELRYTINRPGFRVHTVTLVTTLLDPRRYPKEKLAEAYGLRWHVETCFRHLKTTMRMDVLRCQSVEGVLKELTMFLLVYNLVRMTMLEAAKRQGVPPDRISFIDALRWLATARPGDDLPCLVINPDRPHRVEPRARKRRPKGPWLKQPRAALKQILLSQGLAV